MKYISVFTLGLFLLCACNNEGQETDAADTVRTYAPDTNRVNNTGHPGGNTAGDTASYERMPQTGTDSATQQ